MSSLIQIKNTAISGSVPANLTQGELAINVTNGRLFYGSGSNNVVKEFTGSASGGGGGTINTGSLLTTASFNAYTGSNTSQFAGTASFALTSSRAISASYALTSSFALTSSRAISASYALTASYSRNLQISGSINNVDYIDFNTGSTVTQPIPGRVSWNDTDGTLDIGLKGSNVTLQVGQEQLVRVVNKTATNITLLEANYQAVRLTGAQGQRLKVDLAQATTDGLSAETLGIVTETIANNQEGFITISGLVRGINTTGTLQSETWADGDILYLSPTVAGNITNIKPVAPNHLIIIGYVVYAHINQGKIFVKVDNGYEIDELHNVLITTGSLTPGQLLVRSGSVWINSNQLTGSYGLTGSLNITGSLSLSGSLTLSNYTSSGSFPGTGSAMLAVNNSGSVITQAFRDVAEQVYTGSIAWTGTAAPSGSTTHTYRWSQIGKTVNLNITLVYTGPGNAVSSVTTALPADCPTPYVPSGQSGAGALISVVSAHLTPTTTLGANIARGGLRINLANNGYELVATATAAAYKVLVTSVQYFAV